MKHERVILVQFYVLSLNRRFADRACRLRNSFFSPVSLRPNADHGLIILEVSRSHTTTRHIR